MRTSPLLSLVSLQLVAAVACGQVVSTSQTRFTRVLTTTQSATNFAPFVNTTAAGTPGGLLYQTASQNSSMTASTINANVGFTFAANNFGGVRNVDVQSSFSYTFQLTSRCTFAATGQSVSMMGIGSGTTFARLTGPSGVVFTFDGNAPVPLPFSASGTLQPGAYTLVARSETVGSFQAGGTSGQGGISVSINVNRSCDSIDFNNDGSSFDPQDVAAFLSVFSEGPCIPATATCNDIDFNNDASLFDPCDINSLLLVFSEGPCTLCGS
jgi:hypothetical protein